MRVRGAWVAVGLAAIPAVAGAALLIARAVDTSTPTRGESAVAADPVPRAIFTRQLCSFSNDDAKASLIQGSDGGMSVVVGDRTWWLFGDTLFLAQSGKQIEQNSIAWSDSVRPDGCPRLHYYGPDGVAIPFLQKDGSLTVWPAGAWAVDDHSFDFYTAYVYGSGPYAYTIGEVGLARLDTNTMDVTILSRKLWDADSGFPDQPIGTQPVDVDAEGRLRLVLHTRDSQKLLARVPVTGMADTAAYEYWDGAGWTADAGSAASLWLPPGTGAANDVEKFASFENGASIAWNEALGKYVAILNVGPNEIGARTADRLEGPWSEAHALLDCLTFAEPYVPTCYSPYQHPQLVADNGGRRVIVTLTRFRIYDVAAYEIELGTAIHEYRSGDDVTYAPQDPGDGWSDQGVAFYASDAALPGFAPIYEWHDGDDRRYSAASPADAFARGDVIFFAPMAASAPASLTPYRPVYDWSDGTSHLLSPKPAGLEQYGYQRGDAAFYAP